MWKTGLNPALISVLVIGLHAGMVSTNSARAYDGDIDYSAPYVTLDPKTGKLITVDPKQQQADGQPLPPHPSAPPQDANASQGAADPASATTAATSPATATSPAGTTGPAATSSGTNVMAAVLGLVLIAGVVAVLRRKPATKSDS